MRTARNERNGQVTATGRTMAMAGPEWLNKIVVLHCEIDALQKQNRYFTQQSVSGQPPNGQRPNPCQRHICWTTIFGESLTAAARKPHSRHYYFFRPLSVLYGTRVSTNNNNRSSSGKKEMWNCLCRSHNRKQIANFHLSVCVQNENIKSDSEWCRMEKLKNVSPHSSARGSSATKRSFQFINADQTDPRIKTVVLFVSK